ncbi:TetR/AcrR family transcriptional regulator [Patulibacter americanus]|uniref:TetR/AcrR family transcriptional regulator n=1 Tax=Patulibacter americanus TaxID=588672 RepID=UPI0003B6E662|nr:TetR/AcrR family transcriptional regulator [Patulibacter americanus]
MSAPAPDRQPEGRRALLDATAALVAEQGVRGLSPRAVARRAGTTAALVYYHFGSPAGLVSAALHHANEQAPSVTRLPGPPAGRHGRDALVDALEAEFDDDPRVRSLNAIWNEVGALAAFEPALRDDLRAVTDAWKATVAAAIRRGVADGSVAPDVDADEAAELLTGAVDGLSQRWLAGALTADEARVALRPLLDALVPAG